MKYSSLLGLVPLVLYLGAFTLVPWSLPSSSVFARPKALGGLGLFALSRRIISSAKP